MKTCKECNKPQPLAAFHRKKTGSQGRGPRCKTCLQRSRKARYLDEVDKRRDPEYRQRAQEELRRCHLKRYYNLTETSYAQMLAAQNHVCALCKEPAKQQRNGKLYHLHVDHCHKTGRVSALLCEACNRGLAGFRDRPDLLRAAIAYVETHAGIIG